MVEEEWELIGLMIMMRVFIYSCFVQKCIFCCDLIDFFFECLDLALISW